MKTIRKKVAPEVKAQWNEVQRDKTNVFRISRETANIVDDALKSICGRLNLKYRAVFDAVHLMVWHLTDGGVNLLTPSELKARILAVEPFDPKNELLKGVALKRVTLQNHVHDGYRLLAKPFYDEFCVKEKCELYAYEIPDYLFRVAVKYIEQLSDDEMRPFFELKTKHHLFNLAEVNFKNEG